MLGIGAISPIFNLCFISHTPQSKRARKNGRQNFSTFGKYPVKKSCTHSHLAQKTLHPFYHSQSRKPAQREKSGKFLRIFLEFSHWKNFLSGKGKRGK
jgi:hypothetical protein